MNEILSDSLAETTRLVGIIDSPSKMARALGFLQDSESLHSRDRDYVKGFQENPSCPYPAEITIYSGDFIDAEFEEMNIGVQFKEPLLRWAKNYSVLSNSFLNWFVENGGDSQLAEAVRQLKDPQQQDRIKKDTMKEKGYLLVGQIIQQAEELGYFKYLLDKLSREFEKKKEIALVAVEKFLAEFPDYSLFRNRFNEEEAFYAAKTAKRKGRTAAMKIEVHPLLESDEGVIEFQLGSMMADKEGTISGFSGVELPKFPSTNQYPQRWFKGRLEVIIGQAVEARKQIQVELGK